MSSTLDRRSFLARSAAAAGGGLLTTGALERLNTGAAGASTRNGHGHHRDSYGPLERVADQRGVEVLALPAGFSYVTFSHSGSTMADGNPTPLALDGMGAFAGRHRREVRLVRNSEDRNPPGPGSVLGDPGAKYDAQAGGGTTTVVYDEQRRRLVADWVSLNGTTINCAGGLGLGRRSWLTAEETVGGPDSADEALRFPKRHGYLFEVPVARGPGDLETGEPIREAGRFSHEAAAVDQRLGIVYETEDPGSGVGAGFYRFLPHNPRRLTRGGQLQMLAVRGQPEIDMREGQRVGRWLDVSWVRIDDPDPEVEGVSDPRGVFSQARAKGGALFNRLEGCWEDHGRIFFVSTSGGDAKNGDVNDDGYAEGFGQVWEYKPSRRGGAVRLVYESADATALDSPDNLTVTPGGGLIVCEDDASSALVDTHPLAPGIDNVNRLIGINRRGEAFELAVNVLNGSELAGCGFSPSGRTLFFNLYGVGAFDDDPVEGMTCAVTGPWHRGPL